MRYRAAVLHRVGEPLVIEDVELGDLQPGDVLVRVQASGLCHTDLEVMQGSLTYPLPIVLGHEGAGVVEKVGKAVTKVAVGDHVVMSYNSCGHCDSCNEHAPNYCHDFFGHNFAGVRPDGTSALSKGAETIHGNFFGQSSFANYALCHERNVVKVTKDAPLELLGPLACGIQTGAGAVINALKVSAGRSIAVFGAGSVGLSAVMAARVVGATTIVAVDLNAERLEMARTLGATHTFNPKSCDAVAEIMKATGTGVDYAFESTGVPAVIRNAMDSLAPRGTCGIVGAATLDTEITINAMHLMTAGRSIRGIVEGDSTPEVFIPQLIELHRQGRFPFDKLVSFYPYEKINQAVEDAETGKAIKPIIRMG